MRNLIGAATPRQQMAATFDPASRRLIVWIPPVVLPRSNGTPRTYLSPQSR